MKVLTVRQPYATLIISGIKHIENRSWQPVYRGIIAIHAASKVDKVSWHYARKQCEALGIPCPAEDSVPYGAIIGTVGLMGVVYTNVDDQIDGDYPHYEQDWLKWWDTDDYGWIFKNPNPVENIPIKGKLHLWDLPPDLEPKIITS